MKNLHFYIGFLVVITLGLFVLQSSCSKIYNVENLDFPEVSSSSDVSAGASELYGWGYKPITKIETKTVKKSNTKHVSRNCPKCENVYVDESDTCGTCNGGNKDCRFADITQNIDIDKYWLKSSIPPCPDMSEYAKKNQIPPYPFNQEEWIRKSEIPPCPICPNLQDYIKKSELPPECSCGGKKQEPLKCPECPIAPICPLIPETEKRIEKINYNAWSPKFSELNEGFIG